MSGPPAGQGRTGRSGAARMRDQGQRRVVRAKRSLDQAAGDQPCRRRARCDAHAADAHVERSERTFGVKLVQVGFRKRIDPDFDPGAVEADAGQGNGAGEIHVLREPAHCFARSATKDQYFVLPLDRFDTLEPLGRDSSSVEHRGYAHMPCRDQTIDARDRSAGQSDGGAAGIGRPHHGSQKALVHQRPDRGRNEIDTLRQNAFGGLTKSSLTRALDHDVRAPLEESVDRIDERNFTAHPVEGSDENTRNLDRHVRCRQMLNDPPCKRTVTDQPNAKRRMNGHSVPLPSSDSPRMKAASV